MKMQSYNLKLKIFFCTILFCGIFSVVESSLAACTWDGNICLAPSCDYASLAAEVAEIRTNALSKTGSVTLQLPTCNITQTTDLDISMTSGFSGITEFIFRGHGETPIGRGSAGDTIITDRSILFTATPGKKIRISNLTIAGTANETGSYYKYTAFLRINGITQPSVSNGGYRIDHITWDHVLSRSVMIADKSYGVLDSCNGSGLAQFAAFEDSGADSWGNDSWGRGAVLGSEDANYVENNEITCNIPYDTSMHQFADGAQAARIVVRYNTLVDYYLGSHDASSNARGGLQYEAYNNLLTSTMPGGSGLLTHRGGTGVFYNNRMYHTHDSLFAGMTHTTNRASGIQLQNKRDSECGGGTSSYWGGDADKYCGDTGQKKCLGSGSTSSNDCEADSDCTGSGELCLRIDGEGGYPCRDQIGQGDNVQSSHPFLFWNNKVSRAGGAFMDSPPSIYCGYPSSIVADRDYCSSETIMPTTCNGVATTYTEFQCPHPLTGLTGCDSTKFGVEGYSVQSEPEDTTSPSAPSGLSVN